MNLHRCWLSPLIISLVLASAPCASFAGGFFEKVAKQVAAPVKAIMSGDVREIPRAVVGPIVGPVVDRVATAVGGSIGQTLHQAAQNPTAVTNLANVQFLHAVLSIKALRASGVIRTAADCHQVATRVAATVGGFSGSELQGNLTQELGNAACDTAITPTGSAGQNDIALPAQAEASLGTATGFGGNAFRIWPIAQCIVAPAPPFLTGGPFVIMSNLAALKWNPALSAWIPITQLYLDGSGIFVLRSPLPDILPAEIGYSASGDMFLLNTPLPPGPVGRCI